MVSLALTACQGEGGDSALPLADRDPPDVEDSAAPTSTSGLDSEPGCFADRDGDGYGDPDAPAACDGTAVDDDTDCDDADPRLNPAAAELCDGPLGVGVDEDCDGLVDDADPDLADGVPFYADADGDGYGDSAVIVSACAAGVGAALEGGDCDDTDADVHPGAEEACDGVDRDCDGDAGDYPGAASACAAESCLAVLEALPDAADGAFWLMSVEGPAPVWCDMTTDGGGWTLGFLRNTASAASQGDFGAGDVSPELLATPPDAASTSAEPLMAWVDLNALDWSALQLAAWYDGGETYRSREIPRESLRLSFGEDGYRLYGGETGYYWCGGDAAYTNDGVGAVDNPPGATADCKGHGSLGSGWDFSESQAANAGLSLCGGDGYSALTATWGGTWVAYGAAGAAYAIWVR